MNFYQSITKYYQDIFPLNPAQIKFIESVNNKEKQETKILDIGCAIGDLSIELSKHFQHITAIDLDEEMIAKAKSRTTDISNLQVQKGNMLKLQTDFATNNFDLISCFGNTLVHLSSEEDVLLFFQQAHKTLNTNGKLLVQIINYDRIIDQKMDHLPTIENDNIRFVRNYHYQKDTNKVDFETILTCKNSSEEIRNCISLLALRKDKIEHFLKASGFRSIQFYGNFKKEDLQGNSIPLIFEATK